LTPTPGPTVHEGQYYHITRQYIPPASEPVTLTSTPTPTAMPTRAPEPAATLTPEPEIVVTLEQSPPPVGAPEIKSNPVTRDATDYMMAYLAAALGGLACLTLLLMKNKKGKGSESADTEK